MTIRLKPLCQEFGIFLGYFALAVVLTWPLVRYLGTALPGIGADPVRAYWFNWWTSYAFTSSSVSVLHTPMLFHPEGTPSLVGLFGILYTAVSLLIPYLQSYNLLFLMMFALSAYGCYRLALYMLKDRKAAIYAGVIFGLSPFMLGKGLGHCGMLQAITIPLAMLEMFKALDTNKYTPKRAVLAGFWGGITALLSVYYAIYMGLWFLGFAFWLIAKRRQDWILNWITAIAIMTLVALPKAVAMMKPATEGYYFSVKTIGKWYLTSIDLLGIIIPPWNHSIWGGVFAPLNLTSPERAAFLGISVLALAVLGWRKQIFNNWRVWLGLWTAGAWILALGPMLQVAGKPTFIPLPNALLSFVPVINTVTAVSVWMVLTVLGVALLAGGGVAWLHKRGNWWRWAWLVAILVAVIEYLPVPYPVIHLKHPAVLKQLGKSATNLAVLSLPVGGRDTMEEIGSFTPITMWYQTLHKKPIIGGHTNRMGSGERRSLNSNLVKMIIQTQDSVISLKSSKPAFNPRAQGIRVKVLQWVEKDNWFAGIIRKAIGQEKLSQVLNKAKQNPVVKSEPALIRLDKDTALHQADSLKIGFVLATDLSSSIVQGGLELYQNILPLELLGEESGVALYRINYQRSY